MFERYLAHGERIVDVFRRHPIVLSKAAFYWLVSLAACAVIGIMGPLLLPKEVTDVAATALFVVSTVGLGVSTLRWFSARYAITDRRILLVEGVVSRRVTALNLGRLSDSTYRRSVWGRLFGYGELHLDTAGEQGGPALLRWIPRPDEVYRLVSSAGSQAPDAEDPMVDVRRLEDEDTGPLPRLVL